MIIDGKFKFEVGKYYVSELLSLFSIPRKCLAVRDSIYSGYYNCQYGLFAGIKGEYIANSLQFREATDRELFNTAKNKLDKNQYNIKEKFHAVYYNGEFNINLEQLIESCKN